MQHNMPGCIQKFKLLMGNNFPMLGLDNSGEATEAAIMHDYEIGGASTDDFVSALLPLCRPGTTREDILDAWCTMHGGIPAERLDQVALLHQRFPVYLLSNNNQEHWRDVTAKYDILPLFDGFFLSHEMHMGKPDQRMFEAADRVINARQGKNYCRANTIFVDDLEANRDAAIRFGWQACGSLDELMQLINH